MIKGITRNMHGFADYSYIPLTLAAPTIFKFKEEKWASTICYALSATVLGYSLLTDAKWGAYKLIPYKTHAGIDLALGIGTLALALVPSGKNVKKNFLLLGLIGVVVGTLSVIGAKRS